MGLYTSLPPAGPPNIFPPYQLDMPSLEAGETFRAKITITPEQQGTYQAYVVLYMPNGGLAQWVPMAGVDYGVNSEPFDLTGPAYTHETELVLVPAE